MEKSDSGHIINCEWGLKGIQTFKKSSDVFIIVDVLSFSTSVDIALSNDAVIYPYRFVDETTFLYSKQVDAELASIERTKDKYSLSPGSLLNIIPGTKLVLPSPNGSELSLSTGGVQTLTACLRNCKAVADYAMAIGNSITVIPAGEKWEDGSIRFAIEDYVGAGAVISHLHGSLSAEAKSALASFDSFKDNLHRTISESISGQELLSRGFEEDILLATELNVSSAVPLLGDNSYRNVFARVRTLEKSA